MANVALSASAESTDTILATLVGPGGLAGYGAEALVRDALEELTNEASVGFNATVVDHPSVYYQSWAAVSFPGGQPFYPTASEIDAWCDGGDVPPPSEVRDAMTPLLWATAPFSARTLDRFGGAMASPGDGMVSVASAQWGEFRGCVPADHYDVIGRLGDHGPDPHTGFDAPAFYLDVASDLALEGFVRRLLLLVALGGGCELVTEVTQIGDGGQRCVELNEEIAACFGQDYGPLVCDGISDADLANIEAALDGGACDLLQEAAAVEW